MDASNFMLGHYIKIAMHAPKKYPKKPVGLEDTDNTGQMTAEDEAKINALMGAFVQKAEELPSVDEEAPGTGNIEATQP